MHDELTTPERAAARLVHDTLVHLVRRPGRLQVVRVAISAGWDEAEFARSMRDLYAARGLDGVQVHVLPTEGDPRLLSVVA
jgi:hypothetical protein